MSALAITAVLIYGVYALLSWLEVRRCRREGLCPACRGSGSGMSDEALYWSRGFDMACLECGGTGRASGKVKP